MGCHFRLTHQDRRLEDEIRKKRGEKWYNKLTKMAKKKMGLSWKTISWYDEQIKKLESEKLIK